MATDIFEGSTITFRGRILFGHKSATTATFKILRGGTGFAEVSAPLKDGKAEVAWLSPDVPDLDESYTLTFSMQIEDRVYPIAESYTLWPRWLHLTALRAADDKPFPRFFAQVKQGAAADVVTDAKGEYRHFLKKPAPFTVSAEAPSEITAWVQDKGRRRVFKCVRRYKAEFVAPKKAADGKDIEQLVNLTTADEGRDGKRSLVVVKVGAEGDTKRAPADRRGRKDDVIFIKATFSRASKRNSPAPSVAGALAIKHTPDGKEYTAQVKLGPDGAPATFKLELGLAGGDTCELKVGSTDAVADATIRFVNWRKLFYQITVPTGLAAPDMGPITGALDKVKVKYEKYSTVTLAEADAPAAPAGSWFDGPMVSSALSGRCLNVGDRNKGFFHGRFVDTHAPIGVHVLLCHAQFDAGVGQAQVAAASSDPIEKTTAKITFPPVGGAQVPGAVIDFNKATEPKRAVLKKAFQDGGNGVRNVKWRSLAATGPQKGKKGDVPDDHVDVDFVARKNKIAIKLPADAVAVIDAGAKVRVSCDIWYSLGPWGGESAKNKQLIRASEGGNAQANSIMSHELGHTMNQVVAGVPPGLAAADHDRKYEGRGHQGPHCAEGVAAAVFAAGGSLRGVAGSTCVMFGALTAANRVDFCAKCSPFVIAESLLKLA